MSAHVRAINMASEQKKFSKATDFQHFIESLIVQGDKKSILNSVNECQNRNHLVALGTRLKQLLIDKKSDVIFTKLTLVECKQKILEYTVFKKIDKSVHFE